MVTIGGLQVRARGAEAQPAKATDRARWWLAAYGAGVGVVLFAVARKAMPDDALISLSFARNVAEHGCWCLTTGIESNTATSPLNVWLLAGLIFVTGHAFIAAGVLLAACLAACAVWLYSLGGWWSALLGVALLASSPVLTSSVGLETYLAAAALVGLVRYGAARRWLVASAFVGAGILTRPDLVVPAVVAVALLALTYRKLLWSLPVGGLVAMPWLAFSWWHFGSAWSNTVPLKSAAGGWNGGTAFIYSVDYFYATFPAATALTIATFAGGVVALVVGAARRRWVVVAMAGAGLAHWAVLAAASAPPTEYYLGPALVGLGLAAVLMGADRWSWRGWSALLIIGSLALSATQGSLWAEGVAPMRQNWVSDDEYARVAARLPTNGIIYTTTEIGALAFYCQDRGCTIIDQFLAYPAATDAWVQKWRAAHPWAEWNYARYRQSAPIPVRYRLDYRVVDPNNPGDWPLTRPPGFYQAVRLPPIG